VAGTGLYFGNLAYVRAGDQAARAAAAAQRAAVARQAAAEQQAIADARRAAAERQATAERVVPREPRPASKRQAATDLAGLLPPSASDRSSIVEAFFDLSACGPSLSQDQQAFLLSAAIRQALIKELRSLGLGRYLPAAMLSSLTGAWQASEQADLGYARWAGDENSSGCTPQDYTDPGYTATVGPNETATTDKTSFIGLWNPLAHTYRLPTYTPDQI
jgi:hypothetical protein